MLTQGILSLLPIGLTRVWRSINVATLLSYLPQCIVLDYHVE